MEKQDGKASIPQWYRDWIVNTYGDEVIRELDRIGVLHDEEIGTLGFGKANELMRYRMMICVPKLPVFAVRLPVSIGIGIYRWMPQWVKNLYWK